MLFFWKFQGFFRKNYFLKWYFVRCSKPGDTGLQARKDEEISAESFQCIDFMKNAGDGSADPNGKAAPQALVLILFRHF